MSISAALDQNKWEKRLKRAEQTLKAFGVAMRADRLAHRCFGLIERQFFGLHVAARTGY
jgi:hypothetical protein